MSVRWKRLAWGGLIVSLTVGILVAYRKFVLQAPDAIPKWHMGGLDYELLSPRMLGWVVVVPLLLFVLGRSLADLPWQQRAMSLLLRTGFVVALALSLARPARIGSTNRISTVFVVDVSQSVPDESLGDARQIIQHAIDAKRPDDVVRVVTFARRPRLVPLQDDGNAPVIVRHDPPGAPVELGAGSDLQAAFQHAYGLFPEGTLKQVVLVSDGIQTDGDVAAEANRADNMGVRVFAIPYTRPVPAEVAIRELALPDQVKVGQAFEVHANVYSSRALEAEGKLFQGEALNGMDGVRKLQLQPGSNDVVFRSVVRVAGPVTYTLKLDGLSADRFPDNNHFSTTVDVPGRPTVLYVEGAPARASYLSNALSAQQFDVDVRAATAFPVSLKEMERFDFVILSDTPAKAVSLTAQDLIERYVRDIGGGFLFAGGPAGYGLGGWQDTTIERILPVRMDTEHRQETPSLAMTLVIDRSGSMTGLPLEMAKAASRATVDVLGSGDLIEIIAFDSSPTRFVKMQPARNRSRIDTDIARIQAGGGTDIFSALDAAYQDMTVTRARKKHVVLLTDGRAPAGGIRELIQAMIAESITVTTVALGEEADDELLRMIADMGGGRFHKVTDPNALPRIFTHETEMVARQAAVEEWFAVTQVAPADFLRGLDITSAPFLHGYVATRMKQPPSQLILQSDTGEPILARSRLGLGWTLAWTSDVKNLWAVEWLRWRGYGLFWGQLVREHMRKKHMHELDMRTTVSGGLVHAVVDAFGADDRFENGLDSVLTVQGPLPDTKTRPVALQQTAPGRYEAEFPLAEYGSFLLRAEHMRENSDGKQVRVAVSRGHVSNPYPREYARFEPDTALLRGVAAGGMNPEPKALFDPGDRKIPHHEDLWNRSIFAALILLILDVYLRRVRLFDRKFLPKKRRRAV